MDVVLRHPMATARRHDLSRLDPKSLDPATREWLVAAGFPVADEALWLEALTHGSTGAARDYQRLEFLGDRVLGLTIAEWLYGHDDSSEGELAQRLNALVTRQMCAERARAIGAPGHVRLGKQARDDGAADSDNVLGDVMEALLGASFLERGFEHARAVVLDLWGPALAGQAGRAKHPKSALQEWAAASRRKPPEYEVVDTAGPDHARRFTVRVRVKNIGEVEATAGGKQDAETEAARLFMERFG